MAILKDTTRELLNSVTSTIVYELNNVGVYHYNKLTYLFEYLFIKNFGRRYTNELFIKYPHGPVISNYKRQIENLTANKIYDTNLEILLESRTLEDDYRFKIHIKPSDLISNQLIQEATVRIFLKKILEKYAHLSCEQLEEKVYLTDPIKKYLKSPYKKESGGYVLDSNGIRMKDYSGNPKVKARNMALNHFLKYPEINIKQHEKFSKQLSYLENLRPEWGKTLSSIK